MELIDNKTRTLYEDLQKTIHKKSRLSIVLLQRKQTM